MSQAVRAACSGHIDLEDLIKQVNLSRASAMGATVATASVAMPAATVASEESGAPGTPRVAGPHVIASPPAPVPQPAPDVNRPPVALAPVRTA